MISCVIGQRKLVGMGIESNASACASATMLSSLDWEEEELDMAGDGRGDVNLK